jgi:hypothetical protein
MELLQEGMREHNVPLRRREQRLPRVRCCALGARCGSGGSGGWAAAAVDGRKKVSERRKTEIRSVC